MNRQKVLDQLIRDTLQHVETINYHIGLFGTLEAGLAAEHQQELHALREKLAKVKAAQNKRTANKQEDENRSIIIPHLHDTIQSTSANIQLNTAGAYVPKQELFELMLAREGLTVHDLKDVEKHYHEAVSTFLGTQKALRHTIIDGMRTANASQYKREAEAITLDLDRAASQAFGIHINTPAETDVKEERPNFFLGSINIGYEQLRPKLIRLISHEGPFGHYTHSLLTESSAHPFRTRFQHTSEGLAILGENLGYAALHPDTEEARALGDFLGAKRRIGSDLTNTIIEKMSAEGKTAAEIAKVLESPLHNRQRIEQYLNNIKVNGELGFSFGATPYYVGFEKIRQTFQKINAAIGKLPQENQEKERQRMLRIMYCGYRTADNVDRHISFALNALEKQTGKPQESTLPEASQAKSEYARQ